MPYRCRLAWVAVVACVAALACTAPSQGSDTPVAQPLAAVASASAASAPAGPVGSFTLALAAPAVLIERTKSSALAVSVTRVAPFSGPVTVSVGSAGASAVLPTGVLANALTIPAGRSVGTLTIAVSGAAKFGSSALAVRGAAPGGVASTSAPLALVVGRATGSFAEASPTPYASTVPSNVTSHTAAFRVEVAAAAAGASAGAHRALLQGGGSTRQRARLQARPGADARRRRLLRRPRRRRARPRRRALGGSCPGRHRRTSSPSSI